jgi:hypothetical protein
MIFVKVSSLWSRKICDIHPIVLWWVNFIHRAPPIIASDLTFFASFYRFWNPGLREADVSANREQFIRSEKSTNESGRSDLDVHSSDFHEYSTDGLKAQTKWHRPNITILYTFMLEMNSGQWFRVFLSRKWGIERVRVFLLFVDEPQLRESNRNSVEGCSSCDLENFDFVDFQVLWTR